MTLLEDYVAVNKNILDPNKIKDYFDKIGYDDKNVPLFREFKKFLVAKMYGHLFNTAESKTIRVLKRVGVSGKTRDTENLDFSKIEVNL